MLKIRLSRYGKKNQPAYRVVVSDSRKDTHGTYIESLGSYQVTGKPATFSVDQERVAYWLSQGAQASPTVHNLLVENGVIEGDKVKASRGAEPPKTEDKLEGGSAEESSAATSDDSPETSSTPNNEESENKEETVNGASEGEGAVEGVEKTTE